MSLIVDVNPVPWKILDLVRARILKNRAKKKKVDQGFSATAIRREINAQQGLLAKRRMEEPSFLIQDQGKYGVGWLHIGQNYTVTSDVGNVSDTDWSNGYVYLGNGYGLNTSAGPWNQAPNSTTDRTIITTTAQTASLELTFTVGTGSGETWKQVKHTVNYSLSQTVYAYLSSQMVPYYTDPYGNVSYRVQDYNETSVTGTSNFYAMSEYSIFPAGQSDIIVVAFVTQFQYTYSIYSVSGSSGSFVRSFTPISTRQISFLITDNSIVELTHPVPAFAQRKIDYWRANGPIPNTSYFTETGGVFKNIGIYFLGISANTTSSAIFESILPEGASLPDANNFMQNYSPQQAKASYAAFSGNTEIPVLGYKRDDPSAAITPTTERGVFGIIPGASVTAPVTAEMLAAGLDDEQVQGPGPNAENRTEPVGMIVAYDYHGGTYCRDQLAALGITLP
jgi:hypothetical protein